MPNGHGEHRRSRIITGDYPVPGFYDLLIDARLRRALDAAKAAGIQVRERPATGADSRLLARECGESVLDAIRGAVADGTVLTDAQMERVSALLHDLSVALGNPTDQLRSITPKVLQSVGQGVAALPANLSDHGLLTGREGSESLLSHLRREMDSSDRVDWLVSFVKLSAVKMLREELRALLARGCRVRVITTAYMGATDPKALEELARLSRENGRQLQIRFSQESGGTRLHAKAYIHYRDSGFGSAYIGSANLSKPALTDGLEWTVRLSQSASPGLWSKISETFEEWWGDSEFVEYGLDPDHPSHEQFRQLVLRERDAAGNNTAGHQSSLPIFDLVPKPFQQAILERITAERTALGPSRHLIVAATGTGKTMIAAFDFRAFREAWRRDRGVEPRLLYVAHSQRILEQARLSFGQVLGDLNYGGLLVGGRDDRPCDGLFASIQSWRTKIGTKSLPPTHFDYVVVDEVHHGEAPWWRALLEWVTPHSMLGLTATPERADGLDIRRHFAGRVTAELRLPDAIARRLLVPFRYFGVTDEIDFRQVDWKGARYAPGGVEALYLAAGGTWIELVRRSISEYVADPLRMRAIGFCSGVDHARRMADAFERHRSELEEKGLHSLRAESIDGATSQEDRAAAIGRLRSGVTQIIFVADVLNEGIDIPEVDVVLFMRPTESLTVFLQQLGRGLRLSAATGKECLTVLDFVGHHRREFRFAERLGALLVDAGASIVRQVEQGFPTLPPGCAIVFERVARERVLEHVKAQIRSARVRLIEEVRQVRDDLQRTPTLREFLDASGEDPRRFYRSRDGRMSWHSIAGELEGKPDEGIAAQVEPFMAALRAVAILEGRELIANGIALLDALESSGTVPEKLLTDRRSHMLWVEFGDQARKALNEDAPARLAQVIEVLRTHDALRREVRSLLDARLAVVPPLSLGPPVRLPSQVPLSHFHRYTRRQIRVAFGVPGGWTEKHREGVEFVEQHRAYLMYVTLNKDADTFTERTRYRDFAISPTQFHWQSQSTAAPQTGDGTRIANSRSTAPEHERNTMWLFLRRAGDDQFGAEPFAFMGAFTPETIEGARPMSVTGSLEHPLPPEWYDFASRAR